MSDQVKYHYNEPNDKKKTKDKDHKQQLALELKTLLVNEIDMHQHTSRLRRFEVTEFDDILLFIFYISLSSHNDHREPKL